MGRRGLYRDARRRAGDQLLGSWPLTYVGDPGAADRMGWPVDDIAAYCTIDWADGDGTAIHRLDGASPGLLTDVGGAVAAQGKRTPWETRVGSGVTAARLGTTIRFTASKVGIADDADIIVIELARMEAAIGNSYVFKSYQAAPLRGLLDICTTNTSTLNLYGSGGVVPIPFGTCHTSGWGLRGWVVNRTTLQATPYVGGVAGAPASIAALGSMLGTYPLEIGVSVSVARALIARLMWFEGAGIAAIADATWWQRLAETILGTRPLCGPTPSLYTRATVGRVMYDAAGRVYPIAANTPPAGNSLGFQADEAIANRTSRNHGIAATDTTLIDADVGLTVSVVDDSANLDSACPGEINAIRIQNTTGGTLYARMNMAINTTDVSWCSIRARVVAGPIPMGWQTAAGALTVVVAAISSGYARSAGRAAPGAATDKQSLELPAGADVYIIYQCCGTLAEPRIPAEVPSQANAGSAPLAVQGALTTLVDPADSGVSVSVTSAPDGWNTGEGALVQIVKIGANDFLGLDGATGEIVVTDGTTIARSVSDEADGVSSVARASAGSRGIACLQSGQPAQIAAYDLALPAGAFILRGSSRRITNLEVRRNWSIAESVMPALGLPSPARLALPPDLYCVHGNTMLLVKGSLIPGIPAGYTWQISTALAVAQDATTITLGDGTEAEADYALTLELLVGVAVIDSATSTVHIRDDLIPADPTWGVIMAGDSLTSTGTYPDDVVTLGAGHIVAIGTQATALPTPCEGYPGATTRAVACTGGVVAWVDARNVIDVPAYLAALGSTPEAIVWLLGTNDCYQARTADIEYHIAQSLAYLDRLISAFEAAVPGVEQGVCVLPPGSTSQAAFDASYPPPGTLLVAEWRSRHHRLAEAVIERYGSVAGRLVPVHCHIDGDVDYPAANALHPDAGGYARIAAAVYAWLVSRMT